MLCHRCGKILYEGTLSCPVCGLDLAGSRTAGRDAVRPDACSCPTTEYAGFWRRAAALLIDKLLLGAVNLFLCIIFLLAAGRGPDGENLRAIFPASAIFGFLLQWLYFTLTESSAMRATLGKAVIGITVTDHEGQRISWLRANGRYWSKILSSIPFWFGYLMAGFTRRKQALHDFIAGTLVVRS
jgi:uncharacterized RDD family membrane protein YckC